MCRMAPKPGYVRFEGMTMAASHEDLVRAFDRREPWQKAPYVPHRWRGSGAQRSTAWSRPLHEHGGRPRART